MAMTEISLRQPLRYTIDLSAGLVQQPMRGQLMKGDKKANRVIVHLTDGGKDAALSGVTVTGGFIRPPDSAEIPLKGEASGSEASVTLEDACYATEGYCEISVKLTVGETSRTILTLTGYVLSKGSGAYVDISGVIPNVDDVIAQYAEMKRVTQETQAAGAAAGNAAGAANTAADAANAQAQAAQQAALAANTAAEKIDGMTVSAEEADEAGATISHQDGAYHVNFKLPKGDTGATPDITFEVATGAAGSDVQIEQSGTAEAPHIKLTIPRGDTGVVEGVDYYEGNPNALGEASPGTANGVARGDHVHPKPTPGDIGAASKDQLNQFSEQIAAFDLLDNGDFSIAQAGYPVFDSDKGEYTSGWHGASLYAADRWFFEQNNGQVDIVYDGENTTLINNSAALSIVVQRLSDFAVKELKHGVPYTIAVYFSDGEILVRNDTYTNPHSTGVDHDGQTIVKDGWKFNLYQSVPMGRPTVRIFAGDIVTVSFKRIRLLPGTFTAETLPPVVPKGYGAELAECQRYYQIAKNGVGSVRTNEDKVLVTIPLCVSMRNGISVASTTIATIRANGLRIDNPEVEINAVSYKNFYSACVVEFSGTFTGMGNGIAYIDGTFHLTADL